MIAALLMSLIAAGDAEALIMTPRAPIAVLIGAPRGQSTIAARSELVDAIRDRVDMDTAFRADAVPVSLLEECKGAIGCIADRLPRESASASLLLIVILVERSTGARLDVTLVDLLRARSVSAAEDREVQIAQSAVLVRRPDLSIKDASELGPAVRALFEVELRGVFDARGGWRPFGSVEIAASRPGLEVSIDGARVGVTSAGTTRVADVPVGGHRLVIGGEPSSVEVRAASVSAVGVLDAPPSPTRRIAMWSGVGAAVIGGAVVVAAAARSSGMPARVCFRGAPDCTEGQEFASVSASYGGGLAAPANLGGVRFAPLGFGLIAAGATCAVSTLLFGDEGDDPWPQIAAGVVAGAVGYGLSAAF